MLKVEGTIIIQRFKRSSSASACLPTLPYCTSEESNILNSLVGIQILKFTPPHKIMLAYPHTILIWHRLKIILHPHSANDKIILSS